MKNYRTRPFNYKYFVTLNRYYAHVFLTVVQVRIRFGKQIYIDLFKLLVIPPFGGGRV